MGGNVAKFYRALQKGNEVQALAIYVSSREMKNYNPNTFYGKCSHGNTPMHYAAKYAMRELMEKFLYVGDIRGNPEVTNREKKTCLHLVVKPLTAIVSDHDAKKRADCLELLLNWKNERGFPADLTLQDNQGNTALHIAAMNGLIDCVKLIQNSGAPLFLENRDRKTACDLCEKIPKLREIAELLECAMVFSFEQDTQDVCVEEIEILKSSLEMYENRAPRSYTESQLSQFRDLLVSETADMLSIDEEVTEKYLCKFSWSKQTVYEKWATNKLSEPREAGHCNSVDVTSEVVCEDSAELCCIICFTDEDEFDFFIQTDCPHCVCTDCWKEYVYFKIHEERKAVIECPSPGCSALLSSKQVLKILASFPDGEDDVEKYNRVKISNFVDMFDDLKWCPGNNCSFAVMRARDNSTQECEKPINYYLALPYEPPATSTSVSCDDDHYFCWDCMQEGHQPCSCENWHLWHKKIDEVKPTQMSSSDTWESAECAANYLWFVTQSKKCPKCSSPIQKNDGCNHMKCLKCKHDFCWVCLEPWSKHGTGTGGFFRCNRFDKKENRSPSTSASPAEKATKIQELHRFLHFYSRFFNHRLSLKLEMPLLTQAQEKIALLLENLDTPPDAIVAEDPHSAARATFLENALRELITTRKVLSASYVYGYFLTAQQDSVRSVFEYIQNDLEETAETLAQIVNRQHLSAPWFLIQKACLLVKKKRYELLDAVTKGILPRDTSPIFKRKRRTFKGVQVHMDPLKMNMSERQSVMASLYEMVSGGDGWLVDSTGCHNNIPMLYGTEDIPTSTHKGGDIEERADELKECLRTGCVRKQSVPDSGFCSLSCMRKHKLDTLEVAPSFEDAEFPPVFLDNERLDRKRRQIVQQSFERYEMSRKLGLVQEDDEKWRTAQQEEPEPPDMHQCTSSAACSAPPVSVASPVVDPSAIVVAGWLSNRDVSTSSITEIDLTMGGKVSGFSPTRSHPPVTSTRSHKLSSNTHPVLSPTNSNPPATPSAAAAATVADFKSISDQSKLTAVSVYLDREQEESFDMSDSSQGDIRMDDLSSMNRASRSHHSPEIVSVV